MNYNKYKLLFYSFLSLIMSSPIMGQGNFYVDGVCGHHTAVFVTDLSQNIQNYCIQSDQSIVSSEGITTNRPGELAMICPIQNYDVSFQSAKFVDFMPGFSVTATEGGTTLFAHIADCGYVCSSPCDDGDPCTTNDMYISPNDGGGCDICAGTPDLTACPEGLSDFMACSTSPVTFPSIGDDFSGICYNALTDRFMAVQNGNPTAYEIHRSGYIIRTITLNQFDDTEGIVHLFGDKYAITEERDRTVVIVDIPAGSNNITINHPGSSGLINLLNIGGGNDGLEGITYDAANDKLYIGREENDMDVYVISDPVSKIGTSITNPITAFDLESMANTYPVPFTDLAGLSFTADNTLLLLTHLNETLIEVDPSTGAFINSLNVSFMNQPEGVAVINQNEFVIVGEPNEFMYMVNDLNLCPGNSQAFTSNSENLTSEIRMDKGLDVQNNNVSVYPNPFSDKIKVELNLVENENVRIDIVDLQGRLLKNIVDANDVQKGQQAYTIEGINLESGLYFVKVQAGEFIQTKKITKL